MRLAALALAAALVPVLQGCFPVAVVGVGAGALLGADRRTTGNYLEDARIETRVSSAITREFGERVHVNVTSFNRHVLLTGETPTEENRTRVEQLVSAESGIRGLSNELTVMQPSTLGSRGSDSLVTSNVKLRLIDNKVFHPDHVKVVTERGTVYLLGLVYRKEADVAIDIVRNSRGVQQVVTVFEYLD